MIHNVGIIDRIVRILLGAVLMIFYFTHVLEAHFDTPLLIAGVLMFITAARQCCPIYAILGMGTCTVKKSKEAPRIETKKIDL